MSAEARRLAALSALLLQLHQGSPGWPLAQCQARTLDLLADLLPLQRALWSTEPVVAASGPAAAACPAAAEPPAFDSLVAHGAGTVLQAAYLAGAYRHDRLRAAACEQPGQAVLLRLADPALTGEVPAISGPVDLWQAHGLTCGLGIALDDRLSARRHLLLLWRQAGQRRFTATERLLLQCVAPHAVLALQACAAAAAAAQPPQPAWPALSAVPAVAGSALVSAGTAGGRFTPALALPASGPVASPDRHRPADVALHHARCDGQGQLLQIDTGGFALLRQEWPQWSATQLPEPLATALRSSVAAAGEAVGGSGTALPTPVPRWQGRHITVLWQPDGAGLRLTVRRRLAQDGLSERQRQIAEAYAAGHTGPQIAARLALSPSTVSNHLVDIFKKLGVRSKLALARQLAGQR